MALQNIGRKIKKKNVILQNNQKQKDDDTSFAASDATLCHQLPTLQ